MISRIKQHIRSRVARRHAIILTYHSVPDDAMPFPSWIHMPRDRFVAHMELLAERYNVVPLSALFASLNSGAILPRTVAITFDDGFRNNFSVAFPVLEKLGLPATIFLTAEYIGTEQAIWSDTVACLIASLDRPSLEFQGHTYCTTTAEERGDTCRAIVGLLKELHPRDIDHRIDELLANLRSVTSDSRGTSMYTNTRLLSHEQIDAMLASGLIEVGSHTLTHTILSRLTHDEAWRQISESKRILETRHGPIRFLAYPNGGTGDFSDLHATLSQRAGYDAVFTSISGTVTKFSNPMALSRVGVGSGMSIVELDYLLSGGIVLTEQTRLGLARSYLMG